MNKSIEVEGVQYNVVVVEDHLEKIIEALSTALDNFARGKAVALDFSDLRARGAKTSHVGISTGAASFAKAFGDMIHVMSSINDDRRHKPVAILREDHPDFKEYSTLTSPSVVRLTLKSDGKLEATPVTITDKLRPNWELTREELEGLNARRSQQASPFTNK